MTGLKTGGTNLILINDPIVVKDLLEKRSGIYSARPDLYIREFGNGLNIAFREYACRHIQTSYTNKWKQ